MSKTVNINADLGESFGHYTIGNDAELLKIVDSANVACGMHGGDPTVMTTTVRLAAENGVSIGAHPGFNDLWGFGRREIRMQISDIEYLVSYQIGALIGIATAQGAQVTHVKPHGVLHSMASADSAIAGAIARGTKAVDPNLIMVGLYGHHVHRQAEAIGLRVAKEAYVDRNYEDDGSLTPRSRNDAMIRDPIDAAEHVVRMITEGAVRSRTGRAVPVEVHTLCVHGDEPTAIAVARTVRTALERAGVRLASLPDILS